MEMLDEWVWPTKHQMPSQLSGGNTTIAIAAHGNKQVSVI